LAVSPTVLGLPASAVVEGKQASGRSSFPQWLPYRNPGCNAALQVGSKASNLAARQVCVEPQLTWSIGVIHRLHIVVSAEEINDATVVESFDATT